MNRFAKLSFLITVFTLLSIVMSFSAIVPLYNKSLSGFHDALFDQGKSLKKSHIMIGGFSSLQLMPTFYTAAPPKAAIFPTGYAPVPSFYAGFALWYGLKVNGEFGFLTSMGTPVTPVSFNNVFLPLSLTFSFKKTLHEKDGFAIAFKAQGGGNIYIPLQTSEFIAALAVAVSVPMSYYFKKVAVTFTPFIEGNTILGQYLVRDNRFVQVLTPGIDVGLIFGGKKKTYFFLSLDFAVDIEIHAGTRFKANPSDVNGLFNIGLNFGVFYLTNKK
jgi:hypothetical protein